MKDTIALSKNEEVPKVSKNESNTEESTMKKATSKRYLSDSGGNDGRNNSGISSTRDNG